MHDSVSVFTLILLCQIYTAGADNGADQINVNALLQALATPACIRNCVSNLVNEVKVILIFENIYDNIDLMCHALDSSTECMTLKMCPHAEVYRIATSGLRALCARNMTLFLYNNAGCLQKKFDEAAQDCDNGCQFVKTIAEFSQTVPQQGGLASFFNNAASSCSAMRCFLPCIRDTLNGACSNDAGTVILNALLKPLNALADYLKNAPLAVTRFVRTKVPPTCTALTRPPVLNAMMRSHFTMFM